MVRFRTKKVKAGHYEVFTQKNKGSKWTKAGKVWTTPTEQGGWAVFTKGMSQGARTKWQAVEWLKQWFR
jgi:hypothetical protein